MTDLIESRSKLNKLKNLGNLSHKQTHNGKKKTPELKRGVQNLLETLSLFDTAINIIYDSEKDPIKAKKKIKKWLAQHDNYEIGTEFISLDVTNFLNERIFKK